MITKKNPLGIYRFLIAASSISIGPVLALAQTAPPDTTTTAPSAPPAAVAQEKAVQLAPFEVVQTHGEGYITETSARAFKTNQNILDIPQAVIVVPNDMVKDTGMMNTSEILQFVGIANSFEGETSAMRGSRDNDPYIDDLPDNVPYEDNVFVDSYEIIRGASSVLYPNATLTGLVIKSTKKALPYDQGILDETVTQYGEFRTTVDYNKVFYKNQDYTAAFRLVGAYDYGKQYFYNLKNDVKAIHPSLLFQFHDTTVIHLAYDWQDLLHNAQNWSVMTPQGGLYTAWGRKEDGAPANDEEDMQRRGVRLEIEQKLFDTWETRFEASYWHYQRFATVVRPNGTINWNNLTETYNAFRDDEPQDYWMIQDDTTGTYHVGPVKGESLFGFNFVDGVAINRISTIGPARALFNPAAAATGTPVNTLVVPMTVAGINSLPIPPVGSWAFPTAATRTKTLTSNIYYQENADIIPNWLTLVCGFTWANIETITDGNQLLNSPYVATDQPGQEWLHRFGMTLHLTKDLVFYALDTNRYSVQSAVDYNNNHLPNIQGKDREMGLKSAFLDGRLSSQVSVYKIVQTNQTITGSGFNPEGNFWYIPIGTTTNIGWDGDLEFSLVPGWQLIATWYNGNVRNQTGSNQIAATYDSSWSFFTRYDFRKTTAFANSPLKGLSVGGGLFRLGSFWQSEYAASGLPPGNWPSVVKMHEGDMVNAFVAEQFDKHWSVQVNITNLLDQSFPVGGQGAVDIDPSLPRTFAVTVEFRF